MVSEGGVSHWGIVLLGKESCRATGKIQQRVTKVMRGLSFEKRLRGLLSVSVNSWRRHEEWMEPGSSWWCPVAGPGAQSGAQAAPSEPSLCEWPSTGMGCLERLWCLHSWIESKSNWTQSWTTALGVPGGVGHRYLPQVLSVFLRDVGIWR